MICPQLPVGHPAEHIEERIGTCSGECHSGYVRLGCSPCCALRRRGTGRAAQSFCVFINAIGITAECLLAGAKVHATGSVRSAGLEWSSNQGLQNAIAVRSGWWRSFGSAELSTLVEHSLTTNYNLQAAIARIDEARGTAEIAGAPLYPALSLNGTLDRSNGQGTDLKTSRTQNVFGLATYEIDFWGKNHATAHRRGPWQPRASSTAIPSR